MTEWAAEDDVGDTPTNHSGGGGGNNNGCLNDEGKDDGGSEGCEDQRQRWR